MSKIKSNVVICDNGRRNTHLSNKDPQKYQAILDALVEGEISLPAISAKQNMAKSTLQQIRHDNADLLPDWKQRTIKSLSATVVKLAKHLEENYQRIPPQSLALSMGILSSKVTELEGRDPQVHKHVHIHSHGAVNGLLERLRTSKESI